MQFLRIKLPNIGNVLNAGLNVLRWIVGLARLFEHRNSRFLLIQHII